MRLAVGLIAAVVPLVGAGAAQAAIAGAPQPSFSVRPTYINSALTGASTARFCFDKQVIVNNPTGFGLSGYDTDIVLTSTDATASGNCVNATFSTSSQNGDLGSYTVGEVAEGAVRGLSGEGNRADDTPLSGAGNNNGTTGHETAPDLVKTQYVGSGGANQMAFTFDQQLNSNSVNVAANAFHVVFSTGPNCPPGLTVCDVQSGGAFISPSDPNTAIVQFPNGPNLTQATRVYVLPGAVTSRTMDQSTNSWDSVPANGSAQGQVTGTPSLTGATGPARASSIPTNTGFSGTGCGAGTPSNGPCVTVDYIFSEPVSVNQGATTAFYAYLSDASFVHPVALSEPNGTVVGTGNTGVFTGATIVRAYFTGNGLSTGSSDASAFDEYLVKAAVGGATNTHDLNTPSNLTGPPGTPPPPPFTTGCTTAQEGAFNSTQGHLCAVVSTQTGLPNTPSSEPIGGNQGALSTGFSTAPDVLHWTGDLTTGTVAVTLDQRDYVPLTGNTGTGPAAGSAESCAALAGNIQLLDGDGHELAGGTNLGSTQANALNIGNCGSMPHSGAGATIPMTTTIYVAFGSGSNQLGNAKALEFRGLNVGNTTPGWALVGGDAFNEGTNSGYQTAQFPPETAPNTTTLANSENLQQIVAPSAISGRIHAAGRNARWSHKRLNLRAVLARTQHHNKRRHRR